MNLQRTLPRLAAIALAAAATVALGCGGSDDATSSGPSASFAPDTEEPGAGTIAMLPSTSSGATVTVRVTVTGVPSFFGAAFRVAYDNTALQFNGMTDSTSFLRTDDIDPNDDVVFLATASSATGEVFVTATRVNPEDAPPVDVTATSDLVVLTFTARRAIAPLAPEGRLEFSDPKQVSYCTGAPPVCGETKVEWSGGGISAQ